MLSLERPFANFTTHKNDFTVRVGNLLCLDGEEGQAGTSGTTFKAKLIVYFEQTARHQ